MAAALIADEYPKTTVVTDSITSRQLTEFLEDDLHLSHLRFKRGYKNVINKAKELLLVNSYLKVQDIARMTGFSDTSHFISMFKKTTGMTPLEFRRMH